ncbi:retrotransposon protein, putative, ty1-copia subclass [Tanacetum coccineum]|uniref:Retrotransposon protein, putative, ty1-copia subclass n=1 Tax=Tanacetum coccineum TaxID=301880 RepID=A0ABQ5GNU0_9ASTR
MKLTKTLFTLRYENKEYVLDEQILTINDDLTQEEIEAHQKYYDDANKVSCIMASSMSPELQKTFENRACEMNQQLKEMFQAKASKEHLDVVKSLMACKQKPVASICAFVLEMKGYFDRLEYLNIVFDVELSISIILSGLPANCNQFVLSYQLNGKETSIMELYSLKERLLIPTGKERPHKESPIVGLREVKSEIAPTNDPKEAVCFYCNTKGHWKRSCPKYLKDLKDGKIEEGGHSGMYMIELHNTTTSDSWVLDTGCGTHICTLSRGLKESKRLKHGELNLVMGNRKITLVTRIGKYVLMLNSRVMIDLNNCCYSSEMTRNIISFHALFKDGYKFSFDNKNGDILVYSNDCFKFKTSPCKGIYETVKCIGNNDNLSLNVGSSNELDKSKLWHSHLGHINKKRIAQLQKDGVLESFDFKSDDISEDLLKEGNKINIDDLLKRIKTSLFAPPKIDLSNSGLEEFQEPAFEGYGPKTSKSSSEDISNEVRKSNDAPLVEKLVSDDKLEKKIVFPTVAKIEFGNPETELEDSVRLNSHEDKKKLYADLKISTEVNDD